MSPRITLSGEVVLHSAAMAKAGRCGLATSEAALQKVHLAEGERLRPLSGLNSAR